MAFINWNKAIYRYIFTRVRSRELAEDIVQDAFIKAWGYRKSFDPEKSSLKNWIFIIAINLMRDHFRKKYINTEELNENISRDEDLVEEIIEKDLTDFVFHKLRELDEREQELISLRYKADLSIKETAEVMGMEISATKVAIHRAIKKLQSICNG